MNLLRKYSFLLVAAFALTSHANPETHDVDELGRLRVGAQASINAAFPTIKAGTMSVTPDFKFSDRIFIGPVLYGEYLVSDWLGLGLRYEGTFAIAKNVDISFHDVDAYAKFLFASSKPYKREFYLAIPVGYTAMRLMKGADLAHGFNAGAILGGNYYITPSFGLTTEAAYNFKYVKAKGASPAGVSAEATATIHQVGVNLGIIFRF
jgi:hypothetical protein